jgi:hypothetical protein
MRNISFSKTTQQFRDRTKTVTRRLGWKFLKPGDRLMAVEKAQGLKKGEKVKRLGEIEVVSVCEEPVLGIEKYPDDCRREGFPEMTPKDFVKFFCKHFRCDPLDDITRIEFTYV